MIKEFLRAWLGIKDPPDHKSRIDDIDTRLGHLAKRVDDNENLLKRIHDITRKMWTY